MKIFRLYGFGIFWALAFADAFLIFQNAEQYRIYTRPLLAPVLILTIFATVSRRKNVFFKTSIALALLFAALGDVLWLKANTTSPQFLYGLICFLITQLIFAIYFYRVHGMSMAKPIGSLFTFFSIMAISVFLINFLRPHLHGLLIAVALYSLVISLMVSGAVNLLYSAAMRSSALEAFIPGTLLFALSGLMLALNAFYFEEQVINAAVMLTYCGGLYYISQGFIKHLHKRSKKSRKKELALE